MTLLADKLAKERPDAIAIEAPLNIRVLVEIGAKAETVEALNGLVFLARTVAEARGVPYVETYDVQKVRQHFVGQSRFKNGFDPERGRKISSRDAAKQATEARCRMLGYHVEDDNQADAIALWHYAATQIDPAVGVRSTPLFGGNAADRKSTRLNSSHSGESRMPSSA